METQNIEDNTLNHITHIHPLKLKNISQQASAKPPRCNACRHPYDGGAAFECTDCNYILDSCCARQPRTIIHKAHACSKPLILNFMPSYATGRFLCNACGEEGVAFCFHCDDCEFDLHLPCAALPHTLNHSSHPHQLKLTFSYPNRYICDVCNQEFDSSSQWMYLCIDCDYGGHVSCFMSVGLPAVQQQENARNQCVNQAQQIMAMQRMLQISMMQSNLSARGFRGAANLIDSGPTYDRYEYVNAGPLPGQYASMANSIVMNNLALASLNNNSNAGNPAASRGVGGGPSGANVARSNDNGST